MKKFIFLAHPVIHHHHLISLDNLLWMIYQEDHQSWKSGSQCFLSWHSGKLFFVKVATSSQPTWILSSVCVLAFTNFNFDVIVAFSETWLGFTKTETLFLYTRFKCPTFSRFETNTHVPFDEISGFTYMHMSDFFEHESSVTQVNVFSIYWQVKADVYKSKRISENK